MGERKPGLELSRTVEALQHTSGAFSETLRSLASVLHP